MYKVAGLHIIRSQIDCKHSRFQHHFNLIYNERNQLIIMFHNGDGIEINQWSQKQ